jgi:hypothetical protein
MCQLEKNAQNRFKNGFWGEINRKTVSFPNSIFSEWNKKTAYDWR